MKPAGHSGASNPLKSVTTVPNHAGRRNQTLFTLILFHLTPIVNMIDATMVRLFEPNDNSCFKTFHSNLANAFLKT